MAELRLIPAVLLIAGLVKGAAGFGLALELPNGVIAA